MSLSVSAPRADRHGRLSRSADLSGAAWAGCDLATADSQGIIASTPSAPSAATVMPLGNNDLQAAGLWTVSPDADGKRTNSALSAVSIVRTSPLILRWWTAADGWTQKSLASLSPPTASSRGSLVRILAGESWCCAGSPAGTGCCRPAGSDPTGSAAAVIQWSY